MGMEKLRSYLKSLDAREKDVFTQACKTSLNYLRRAISTKSRLGEGLVIRIEKASAGAIKCEELRPDVDWQYFRSTLASSRQAEPDRQAEQTPGEVFLKLADGLARQERRTGLPDRRLVQQPFSGPERRVALEQHRAVDRQPEDIGCAGQGAANA